MPGRIGVEVILYAVWLSFEMFAETSRPITVWLIPSEEAESREQTPGCSDEAARRPPRRRYSCRRIWLCTARGLCLSGSGRDLMAVGFGGLGPESICKEQICAILS
jgi:hypothetical protein